jgi:two-component system, cell cycle sensor histidine kinase and response regulator CckA
MHKCRTGGRFQNKPIRFLIILCFSITNGIEKADEEAMAVENEHSDLRNAVAELRKKCARLEDHLRQSEERFYRIFHASSNMMAITTIKDGRIIELNEASANLGAFKREALIGALSQDHGLWADSEQRDIIVRKLRDEGKIHNLEVSFLAEDGETHRALFSADPITINDEPCLLSISVDITMREKEADALRKSEEKYRMLVENSLQGVAIIQDEHYVFCNSAYARMTGYSIDELLTLSSDEMGAMCHPDDRAFVWKRHQDRLAGKEVTPHYECRAFKKDRTLLWLEVHSSLTEYNGKLATQLLYLDITERKQAENALRESEERFRLIAETIDEIFWIYDLDKGTATYISPAHERIWGTRRDNYIENFEPSFDQIHPEDRERVASVAASMKNGQPLDYEHRIIRPDGAVRRLWNRCFPIVDENGQVKRYVGVAQDVTARWNAEEALKESREYLNQIINRVGDPIFVKDDQHKFVLVNDAMCELSGMGREELLGVAVDEFLYAGFADTIRKQEQEILDTGSECLIEENVPDKFGKARAMMSKKTRLIDKSGRRHLIGVLRDITEYKRLQVQFMQSQKMEAIGLLAGGVAHDFNNLLTVIRGYSELLLRKLALNDSRRRDLEQIMNAGQQAASLTAQLLAFSRKQILQPKVLSLNDSMDETGKMLRRLIGEDIDLVAITQPGLGLINADPGQIQQILLNLAVNARDAMPQGGKLTIETANVEFDDAYVRKHPIVKKGIYVMLSISDNGIGMDEPTQSRIFEPFFTTKAQGAGTGLGLSTVYGIVKQSNGFIWVYSEIGKGTTFKIYFPRVQDIIPDADAELKPKREYRGSETILLAEDDASVRELSCLILRDQGYTVLSAQNGREALAVAQEYSGHIHLVITDVVMPGMSGREFVMQLEASRPGTKALYVSGYADNAIVHHGMLDANLAFLQKPFAAESLARKVREVIEA